MKSLADNELIIDSDISNFSLENELVDLIESKSEKFFDNFTKGFNPILPLCWIALSQGYRMVISKDKKQKVLDEAIFRSKRSLILSTFGSLYFASGLGIFKHPNNILHRCYLQSFNFFKECYRPF